MALQTATAQRREVAGRRGLGGSRARGAFSETTWRATRLVGDLLGRRVAERGQAPSPRRGHSQDAPLAGVGAVDELAAHHLELITSTASLGG